MIQDENISDSPLSLAPIVAAKPKRRSLKKKEKKWIAALSVRTDDGKVFRVPVNADSATAQRQLLASKLLSVFDQNVNFILDNHVPMLPKDLSDLAKAGATIAEMNEAAHKGVEGPAPTTGNTQLAQLAHGMMNGAVGAIQKAQMSMEERLAKIQALGLKQKDAIIVSSERMEKKAETAQVTIEPEQP